MANTHRQAFYDKAEKRGIDYSKYWPTTRLEAAIAAHESSAPEIQTTMAAPDDRMVRYRRNPPCPKCGAHPVVCMMRRPGHKVFRCRECGYRWEIK